MHVEPPQTPIHSWKAFGAHYFMIVVSILTALGLEELVLSRHRAHAADVAQHEIEAELQRNLADARESLQINADRLKPMEALKAELVAELKSGTPNADNRKRLMASARDAWTHGGIWTATLQHEAWDVAVANQSAAHIPNATLRKFAGAYASQRDSAEAQRNSFTSALDQSHAYDVMTDVELGTATPQDVLHVTQQVVALLSQTQNQLRQLEKALVAALPPSMANAAEGGSSTPATSAAAR